MLSVLPRGLRCRALETASMLCVQGLGFRMGGGLRASGVRVYRIQS